MFKDEKRRKFGAAFLLTVLLIIMIIVSLTFGRYGIPLDKILEVLGQQIRGQITAENVQVASVLFVIRIPRILLAAMAGAALAASGAAYQGMFRNPMVSPDIVGVSSGAAVGAALGLLFEMPSALVHLISFLFGVAAVLLVMFLAKVIGKGSGTLVIMVLSGTVISSVFSSITSLIKYVADTEEKLPEITFWLMGSFARSSSYANMIMMGIGLLVGGGILMLLRWKINGMAFGEDEAKALGINTARVRMAVILSSTLLTAMTVCICGTIGWVGLIIPHISRLLVGPNYKSLMPISMLGGACFMLLVDNVARSIIPGELPISILTSMIGAPLFIYMLFKGRRDWL